MTRLRDEPMRELIEEIVQGDVKPGEKLDKETDLEKRFGISRGVVREVIRGLEERGLVTVTHGRGQIVRDPVHWHVLDTEVLTAMLGGPERAQLVEEALEFQRFLGPEGAALAASRAGADAVDEIRRAQEAVVGAATRAGRSDASAQRYREADYAFHAAVLRASGNRILARMSEPLHQALVAMGVDEGDPKRRVAEHERVVEAIAGGDAEAARVAMADHLAASPKRGRRRGR